MLITQELVSAFVQANSAHQHVIHDAGKLKNIAQSYVSVCNVPIKTCVVDHNARHASIDSLSSNAALWSDSTNATSADPTLSRTARNRSDVDSSGFFSGRPSIAESQDSGIESLAEEVESRIALTTAADPSDPMPAHSRHTQRRPTFTPPAFDYCGEASLTAKFAAATLRSSPRLLMSLMTNVTARDVELGQNFHRQEAACALKAMANSAEATLRALDEENAMDDRHYTFITSLKRCETVLIALDDRHGYSKRSKHSSRRLILERTCTALKGIHERYDASKQQLIEAHDRRPYHQVQRGDLDILLQPDNVIHLMRHGAGKSVAVQKQLADYQTHVLEVRRRINADYAEPFHRL